MFHCSSLAKIQTSGMTCAQLSAASFSRHNLVLLTGDLLNCPPNLINILIYFKIDYFISGRRHIIYEGDDTLSFLIIQISQSSKWQIFRHLDSSIFLSEVLIKIEPRCSHTWVVCSPIPFHKMFMLPLLKYSLSIHWQNCPNQIRF